MFQMFLEKNEMKYVEFDIRLSLFTHLGAGWLSHQEVDTRE